MTQYLQYLVFLGVAVQAVGVVSYIKETLKGNTKPNKISWMMWSIAPMIATVAALVDGVRWAVLPVFISGFGPLMIFIASFVNKNSYWKISKLDIVCGICSVLALILWGVTKEPIIAIIFAIASDGLAAVPTLVKSWQYPETETAWPFVGGLFNSLTSFAAIKMWSFAEVAFPTYLVIINIFLIISILHLKIFKKEVVIEE